MRAIDVIITFMSTLIVAILLWRYPLNMSIKDLEKRSYLQFVLLLKLVFISMFGLGLIAHRIFRIESASGHFLGISNMPKR
jgi:NhaP-type Na+/H+ or K+/H+ antiporter